MSATEPMIIINGIKYKITDIKNFSLEIVSTTPNPDPDPDPDAQPPEKGTVLHGGWGGNNNPAKWKVSKMKKPKDQFKVVDDKKVNIATNFTSEDTAQQFIDWSKKHGPLPPDPPVTPGICEPGYHHDETGKCVPDTPDHPPPTGDKDQFGILKIAPDKTGGKINTDFTLEEKERNYASGAPSEWSCEYTADLGDKLSDIEVTYYVKINGFKDETDNISTKVLGPSHQDGDGRSWYISEIQTDGSDKETLKTESPHPVYFQNHQPTKFKIGQSIVGQWIGVKVITYLINNGKDRYIATYLDTPVTDINNPPNNWREYWSVNDTGQLDHAHFITPTGSLVTSRIDGITKGDPPDFKYASVREVVAAGTTPTPPPTDPGNPPPNPTGGDADKFGVKSIYPQTGKITYDYILKPNQGLRHNFDAVKFPTPNGEVTGYFSINQAPDDEVSGKWSVTTHSDGNHVKCLDIGVGNKNGAARYRYEDPHPNYTNTLATGSRNGLPLESKYRGWKFIRITLPDGTVQLEAWQDQGNNEGDKPANEWVQLAQWKVDKQYSVTDYPDGIYAVLRLDGDGIEENLKSKWLSYVEVMPQKRSLQ